MTDSRTDVAVPSGQAQGRLARLAHSAKTGALKLAGTVRTEAGEAIEAAGVSVARLHRRMILVIAVLILVLLLGTVFRALGMAWMNYALIALVGLGAAWAFLQPAHLAGMLLVGGGVAAFRGMGDAGSTVLGYARLLGRILLALLVPLLLFALAPGDRSLGASLPFLVLAPFVLLASWMFGKLSPKVEQALFVVLPLGALLIALGNMLVPERTLAALGVPAWLRAGRPQDEELAAVERLRLERANALRAEQLRAIRRKLEANQPLTAEDEAVILAAQKDRVTLTGWFGDRYSDLAKQVKGLAAPPRAPPQRPCYLRRGRSKRRSRAGRPASPCRAAFACATQAHSGRSATRRGNRQIYGLKAPSAASIRQPTRYASGASAPPRRYAIASSRRARPAPRNRSGGLRIREELGEFAALVHLHHDVRTTYEFALHIELRDGRPVGEFLDPLAHALVLEHVDALELDTQMGEDRNRAAGEAALREQRAALHEQQHRIGIDQRLDARLGIVSHFTHSSTGASVVSWSACNTPPMRPPSAA